MYERGIVVKIVDILKNGKPVFVLDDVENKKTKALISSINSQMMSVLDKLEEFKTFSNSAHNELEILNISHI